MLVTVHALEGGLPECEIAHHTVLRSSVQVFLPRFFVHTILDSVRPAVTVCVHFHRSDPRSSHCAYAIL